MTIGTVRVAFFRRCAAGVVVTAITSGLSFRHLSISAGDGVSWPENAVSMGSLNLARSGRGRR